MPTKTDVSEPITDDAAQEVGGEAVDESLQEELTDPSSAGDGGTEAASVSEDSDSGSGSDSVESPDDWRQQYEQLGFQNFETPEEAQTRALEALRLERERRQQAEEQMAYMRAIHSRLDTVAPAGTQAQSQPEQTQADADADALASLAKGWVELDSALYAKYVIEDENGRRWKEGTPPEARARLEKNLAEHYEASQRWAEIIGNPRRLSEAIDKRVERMMSDRLTTQLSERDQQLAEQRAEQDFLAANQWIYERDPVTGGQAYDGSGNPILSRDGQRLIQFFHAAGEKGLTRFSDRIEWAMDKYQVEVFRRQQAPAQQRQQAAAVATQQRQRMLGRAAVAPPNAQQTVVSGVSNGLASPPTGSRNMSATLQAIAELKEEGYA